MLLNAVLRPQNVCKRVVFTNRSLSRYTPDFSAYITEKAAVGISVSNSWIYTYSTRYETGYGETKQSSINKSMFSSENFQKLRAVKDSPWLCAT